VQVEDVADADSEFGEQLRRDRLAAGLTQEELAERSRVSVRAISDMERGRTSRPRHSTLRHIADALRLARADDQAIASAAQPGQLAQLPADLADFTGRREQVEQLTSLLAAAGDGEAPGAVIVSAVAGAGGIGKSALAVHAAHLVAPQFPDGQLYLNLRGSGTQPLAPGEALARFLRDLGADPAAVPVAEGERAARYRSLLAGRRLLIVLDDARDAAEVRPLLPGTAGCAVVVTSRSSLPDLESARLLDLDILDDNDAWALFERIAGPARAAAEPDAVREVLTACGGLPLAIRIAAARLTARPSWSITALAARLSDERKRLDELETGDLAVRATFMVSYTNVRAVGGDTGEPPDRAFRMLGLADGPDISLPAAAALLGVPLDGTEQVLELLVDAHLLQSAAAGRYRFHDLLRVYAAERVQAEEDTAGRGEAVRRMLSWYLHTAAAACRLINPYRSHILLGPAEPGTTPLAFDSYGEALAWLDAEHANLLTGVYHAARQGEHDIAWQLPSTLWDLFNLRGRIGDWLTAHQSGLASARLLGDRAAEKRMLANLAGNYLHLGQPLAALDCIRQISVIARELGDVRGVATALVNLGVTLTELGRPDEAMQPLQEGLGLDRDIGDRNGEAIALCGIGAIYGLSGRFSDAISHYHQGLSIFREINNMAIAGESLIEISTLRLQLGQFEAADQEAAEAVELSRQTGMRRNEARALAVLGHAHRGCGEHEGARQCWLDAIVIFTDLGHPQADEVAADLSALEPTAPRSVTENASFL
jgi:transcriptional regulator with XRE-family HTH domain/tetratricopeptide (TPR) repeat protein